MLAGELYRPVAPKIIADQASAAAWLARDNTAAGSPPDALRAMLAGQFAAVGRNVEIRPPSFATMVTISVSGTACSSISTA
jgi:hypothetical protein